MYKICFSKIKRIKKEEREKRERKRIKKLKIIKKFETILCILSNTQNQTDTIILFSRLALLRDVTGLELMK